MDERFIEALRSQPQGSFPECGFPTMDERSIEPTPSMVGIPLAGILGW